RARRARPHRRGRGSRVRLCPYRLPPWPGPVAPARLARLRPGAVVARAQPRVSAQPPPVGPRRGRDRRGGRGGPGRPVPTRLRPRRRRRARQRLTGVTLPPGRVTTRAPVRCRPPRRPAPPTRCALGSGCPPPRRRGRPRPPLAVR